MFPASTEIDDTTPGASRAEAAGLAGPVPAPLEATTTHQYVRPGSRPTTSHAVVVIPSRWRPSSSAAKLSGETVGSAATKTSYTAARAGATHETCIDPTPGVHATEPGASDGASKGVAVARGESVLVPVAFFATITKWYATSFSSPTAVSGGVTSVKICAPRDAALALETDRLVERYTSNKSAPRGASQYIRSWWLPMVVVIDVTASGASSAEAGALAGPSPVPFSAVTTHQYVAPNSRPLTSQCVRGTPGTWRPPSSAK